MKIHKSLLMPSFSAFFLTLMPLLSSSFWGSWLIGHETLVRSLGIKEWLYVCVGCTLACACALLPPTLLAVTFGYFLGWTGLIPVLSINLVAILLVYKVAGSMDQQQLKEYLLRFSKVQLYLQNLDTNQLRFVFFTKLSPILPFALTNLLFALLRLRLSSIFLGGFLGMLPRTALAVWIGVEAQQIKELIESSNGEWHSQIAILVLTVASFWGLGRLFSKSPS